MASIRGMPGRKATHDLVLTSEAVHARDRWLSKYSSLKVSYDPYVSTSAQTFPHSCLHTTSAGCPLRNRCMGARTRWASGRRNRPRWRRQSANLVLIFSTRVSRDQLLDAGKTREGDRASVQTVSSSVRRIL